MCGVFSLLLIFFSLVFPQRGSRQPVPFEPQEYIISSYQTEDGLPQNSAMALHQTRDGYLWFGTDEGLVKYDGSKFIVFDSRTVPAFRSNVVSAICEVSDGSLWVGTPNGGVVHYKNKEFFHIGESDGLSDNVITSICEANDGAIWIGTRRGGISIFKDGHITYLNEHNGLPSNRVVSLWKDKADGAIWIGSGREVLVYEAGKIRKIEFSRPSNQWGITAFGSLSDSTALFGTPLGGLYTVRKNKVERFPLKSVLRGTVRVIQADRKGNIWIGTDRDGLLKISPTGEEKFLDATQGFSAKSVASLLEDREGNIWVGTAGNGLNKLQSGIFAQWKPAEESASKIVQSVYTAHDGTIWAGTEDRIYHLDKGLVKSYGSPSSARVLSFGENTNGNMLIGTQGAGLYELRGSVLQPYLRPYVWSNDLVLAIHKDRNNALWIGTRTLLRVVNGRVRAFPISTSGYSANIISIAEDRDGVMWFGSSGRGLFQFVNDSVKHFDAYKELNSMSALALYADDDGNLWIGSNGRGLFLVRKNRLIRIGTHAGLFDNTIFSIQEDKRGNLWMTCNKGIFRGAKKDFIAFADGKDTSVVTYSYGTDDGLLSPEFNGGSKNSGALLPDGRLCFPTVRGLVIVDPSKESINTAAPPLAIEQVLFDGKELPLAERVLAPAGKGNAEFHFTALSFVAPKKVLFKYMLDGFDTDWVVAGTRRAAYYTNIPPGEYSFRVKACNNDGVWNEAGVALPVSIEPHYYQTRWFYALVGLFVLSLGFSFYYFAMEYKERQRRALQLEAQLTLSRLEALRMQLRPHFFFNALNAISNMVLKEPKKAVTMISQLSDLLRKTLDIDKTQMVSLNSELDFLRKYLAIEKSRFGKRLKIQFKIEPGVKEASVPSLILQPLVENAINHGTAKSPKTGLIQIQVRKNSHGLELTVRDNGHGFPENKKEGIGLSNTRARLEQLYGRSASLEIAKIHGGGVSAKIVVPFVIHAEET